jgi:hypothetical protein
MRLNGERVKPAKARRSARNPPSPQAGAVSIGTGVRTHLGLAPSTAAIVRETGGVSWAMGTLW